MLDIAALCLVVTALLTYLNHRFTRLPMAIGVMVIALGLSLAIVLLDAWGMSHALRQYEESFLRSIDFSDVLMQGMLSFVLFAGALHIDLRELRRWRLQVGALALVGTLLSTLLIGTAMWLVLPLLGILASGTLPTLPEAGMLLLREAGGGIVFGLLLGWGTVRLLHSIDEYKIEVLLTLAAVMGGYALASHLYTSGPLAMVVAGLMVGNGGRARHVRHHTPLCGHVLGAD